jgi:hypothetical protein
MPRRRGKWNDRHDRQQPHWHSHSKGGYPPFERACGRLPSHRYFEYPERCRLSDNGRVRHSRAVSSRKRAPAFARQMSIAIPFPRLAQSGTGAGRLATLCARCPIARRPGGHRLRVEHERELHRGRLQPRRHTHGDRRRPHGQYHAARPRGEPVHLRERRPWRTVIGDPSVTAADNSNPATLVAPTPPCCASEGLQP